MSLTLGPGPLGTQPGGEANYSIDGPRHRIWFQPHPRRMRAEVGGRTVLDSTRGYLLHESNIPPRLYVPLEDLDSAVLEATDHTTHCPFKGDASYYTVRVGDVVRENAVWAYPDPMPEAAWLAPYASLYWNLADAWYEEDERLPGLRDQSGHDHVTLALDVVKKDSQHRRAFRRGSIGPVALIETATTFVDRPAHLGGWGGSDGGHD